jgi:hypothetical protein
MRREQVMAALFARLETIVGPVVRRNEALPIAVPEAGLIILRDGEPGEADITLNPRTEYYSHRAELEVFVTPLVGGGGEALLDALMEQVAEALADDRSLGGLAEYLALGAAAIEALVIEGAAPILAARLPVLVEYLVSDPLAA